jgi:hypothetical protein
MPESLVKKLPPSFGSCSGRDGRGSFNGQVYERGLLEMPEAEPSEEKQGPLSTQGVPSLGYLYEKFVKKEYHAKDKTCLGSLRRIPSHPREHKALRGSGGAGGWMQRSAGCDTLELPGN